MRAHLGSGATAAGILAGVLALAGPALPALAAGADPTGMPSGRETGVVDPVGPGVPAWSYALAAVVVVLLVALAGRTRRAPKLGPDE